ncbi:MAG: hypothetical protein ACI88H_000101 [Cocleimonas sp.]|jgi:hypothetical protein
MIFSNANFTKTIYKNINTMKIKTFSNDILGGWAGCAPSSFLQNLRGVRRVRTPFFFTKFKRGAQGAHPSLFLVKNALASGT